MLAPARRWDCYMAHTGGAAFMALPTSYSASSPADSSPVGPGAAQQVLPCPRLFMVPRCDAA